MPGQWPAARCAGAGSQVRVRAPSWSACSDWREDRAPAAWPCRTRPAREPRARDMPHRRVVSGAGPRGVAEGPADGGPLEHLGQELLEAAAGGCLEELLGRSRLDDPPTIHEVNRLGYPAG